MELLSLSLSLYNLSNPNLIPRRCLDRPDVYTVSTSFSQVYHVRTEGGVTAGAGGNETKKKGARRQSLLHDYTPGPLDTQTLVVVERVDYVMQPGARFSQKRDSIASAECITFEERFD